MKDEAERIKTVLRSLVGAGLKLGFLRDYVGTGDDPLVAGVLDELARGAALADETAREPVLALAMLLASLGDDPIVQALRESVAALDLVNLGRMVRRGPDRAEQPVQRVPEYGLGRELSLGERKSLARTPSRTLFDKLLRDPNPQVIRQLLENPRLTEADVIRLTAMRPANPYALAAVARTDWLRRPHVRMALIQNPGTPWSIAVPLIAVCTRPELADIKRSMDASDVVRETARELWTLRHGIPSDYPSSSPPSSSQLSSAPSVTLDAQASQRGGSS